MERLIPALLLAALALGALSAHAAAANSGAPPADPSATLYLHQVSAGYTVGSIDTYGVIMNTSALFGSGTVKVGSGGYTQYWYLSELLAGNLNITGTPTAELYLATQTPSSWSYTLQLVEDTAAGSTVAVLSQAAGSVNLSNTAAGYTFTLSQVKAEVPAGNELALLIKFEPTTTGTVYLYADSPTTPSNLRLPLGAPPVSVGTPVFIAAEETGSGYKAEFRVQVNDSFGLYDLHRVSGLVVPPQGALFSVAMQPQGVYTPGNYSSLWYGYAPFQAGFYSAEAEAEDNSGNLYTGGSGYFTAVGSVSSVAIWGVIVALAISFSVISFSYPANYAGRKSNVGFAVSILRVMFFSIAASVLWFVAATDSAFLSVFIGFPLLYLFGGFGFVMLVYGLGITIFLGLRGETTYEP